MRTLSKLTIVALAIIFTTSCSSKQLYRDAAESGWQRWEEDRKVAVPNKEFSELPDDERKLYMSESRKTAREFERDQAFELLKD